MEELYYPCSENNGADQLCSYCTADLRLCFRIGKIRVSHDAAQIRKTESAVSWRYLCYGSNVWVLIFVLFVPFVYVQVLETEWPAVWKKAQAGKDQEKAQSEKDSHSKNRTTNQVLIP